MKVALIQMNAVADKKKNVAKAVNFVENAIKKRAEFILLPEVFNYRGRLDKKMEVDIKEDIPGESTRPFMELAKRHGVSVLAGSVHERIPGSDKIYNTSVFIDSRGEKASIYRKMNLFDAIIGETTFKESYFFKAGRAPATASVGDFTVGLSVCYDLRFPQLYRRYLKKGANVLAVPSAFTRATGEAHWEVLLRARAIENLSYVLAPNQVGPDHRGVFSYGHSMVVDPWGKILAEGSGDNEEVVYADLSMTTVQEKRAALPSVAKL